MLSDLPAVIKPETGSHDIKEIANSNSVFISAALYSQNMEISPHEQASML